MLSPTNEQALEATIEKKLTGTTREELMAQTPSGTWADAAPHYRADNGYYVGNPADFDAPFAIDTRRFWHFLESTQPDELAKLKTKPQWELLVMQTLDRLLKKYGVLHLLRKGLAIDDARFTLLYAAPLVSSSDTVKDAFERNEFSVTRQIRYSTANPREELDMVVFINGLPVATIELKNAWTGQTARVQGIKQYQFDRDATQPLLQFGRCVVHFAVDTDEVFMTTRLAGRETFFLPFNKGTEQHGAGNPPNTFGHKTAYLWDDVLTRQSLSAILQHFVTLDGTATRSRSAI